MADVQRGTTSLPIIIKPRINGQIVTQTEIKNTYSNFYVNDLTTPLTWVLSYWKHGDATVATVNFDPAKSTDSVLYFTMPDSFYADYAAWSFMINWAISTEKIHSNEAIQVNVKDLYRGL